MSLSNDDPIFDGTSVSDLPPLPASADAREALTVSIRLASPEDWRCVIAVALDEAAKNPGALFHIDPGAPPESHLATTLIGMILQHAAQGLRQSPAPGVGATTRRRGSVLFGSTLREAISMTLRAAANNARALLDDHAHVQALSRFVGQLQSFTEEQHGRIGGQVERLDEHSRWELVRRLPHPVARGERRHGGEHESTVWPEMHRATA